MKTREFSISTDHEGMYNITARLREVIRESGVQSGLAVVYCPHTTAGITINENADPDVQHDLLLGLREAFPDRREFRHAEGNSTDTSSAAMSARARPCSSRTANPFSASGRACTSASSTVRAIAATILR